MPYKEPKIEKVFFTISEVAEMFDVNTSLIRFWDKEFTTLKPTKNNKGNRLFTPGDIKHLKLIHHLVKEKGMTLKGARKLLMENRDGVEKKFAIIERLQQIKQQLTEIRDEMSLDE